MPANLVHRLAISTEFSFYIDIHKDHDSCWYTTVTNNSRSPSHSYTYCIWADRWNGRHEPVTIQSNLQFSAYEQTQNLCKHLLIKPRSLSIIHCITQMHTITFCGLIMIIFCHIHLYLQSRSQDNDFFIQILRILKIFNNLQFFLNFNKKDGYRQRKVCQFSNRPNAQFGYLRRVMPACHCLHPFCGWRHLATSRESKAHFGRPWVRQWDNRGWCYSSYLELSSCRHPCLFTIQFVYAPFKNFLF